MTDHRSWTEQQLRAALEVYEQQLRSEGKTRNTVNTYVQHPERFINWLVRRPPDADPVDSDRGDGAVVRLGREPSARSKYAALRVHLAALHEPVVRMSFGEIERVLGRPLPASARRYRPWWSNDEHGTHSHARAWLDAGRRTAKVDLNGETVEFHR